MENPTEIFKELTWFLYTTWNRGQSVLQVLKWVIPLTLCLLMSSPIAPSSFAGFHESQLSTQRPLLADVINKVTDNVYWEANPTVLHDGIILHKVPPAAYDSMIQEYSDQSNWEGVLLTKRLSEIDGYDSIVIDKSTEKALRSFPMLANLPDTESFKGTHYFSSGTRYVLNGYRYATQFGNISSLWNATKAYDELLRVYAITGEPSLRYNPVNNTSFGYSRYYDESAETLDTFVKLGGKDPGVWDYINQKFWLGNFYLYQLGRGTYEGEVGGFALIIGYYAALNEFKIPYFNRTSLDLYTKLLAQGWESPLWGIPGVLQHAYSVDRQLRLQNTLESIIALHAFYAISDWKQQLVDLLSGKLTAWQALLDSPLYENGRFSFSSYPVQLDYNSKPLKFATVETSDEATADGVMTLLLEGIVPNSGSLAVPFLEESYEHAYLPVSQFSFDYPSRRIRIPVWAGDLGFQFGSTLVFASFPFDGVYDVDFSSDWNSVTSVRRLGGLGGFEYAKSLANEPANATYSTTISNNQLTPANCAYAILILLIALSAAYVFWHRRNRKVGSVNVNSTSTTFRRHRRTPP